MANSEPPDADNQEPPHLEPVERRKIDRAELLDKAIEAIEKKLSAAEVKATFADFIRLLQLQKEMQTDQPREVKVTWIDPSHTESASEE
ncbi:MAG TPA: hypothetical protein VEU11_06060 [Terriglobales bacterium]|nr:hypothetical protein [Terriglobales bacterium]